MEGGKKGLFLDRDGVVVKALAEDVDHGYLLRPEQLEIMPGLLELIAAAKAKGYVIAVATNQPQVAKGLLSEDSLKEIHGRLLERVSGIERIYHCPHAKEHACECRKPRPGLLFRAAEELDIDLSRSVMVGDTDKDVQAAQAAGCKAVFLRSETHREKLELCAPDWVVEDLRHVIGLLP